MADQPAEDIAQRMRLPKSLVELYEARHFNIRSKLVNSSLVLHEIIGVPTNGAWSHMEVARLWQWIGFMYGSITLDLVIPPYVALSDEIQSIGLWAYLRPACDVYKEFRMLVASKLLPMATTASENGQPHVVRLKKLLRQQLKSDPRKAFLDIVSLCGDDRRRGEKSTRLVTILVDANNDRTRQPTVKIGPPSGDAVPTH